MYELKTKPTKLSPQNYLEAIDDAQKRADALELLKMFKQATKLKPEMLGDSVVGFGRRRYKGARGRECEWFTIGFAPRKHHLAVYLMSGFDGIQPLLDKLGKHKLGKGCLCFKSLADLDQATLKQIIDDSIAKVAASRDA